MHTKYGRIEVDQDYLNYYSKTPQTVANGAAKKAEERAAAKGVAKMAADVAASLGSMSCEQRHCRM